MGGTHPTMRIYYIKRSPVYADNINIVNYLNKISESIENLLLEPGKELGRFLRFIRFQVQLCRFGFLRLKELNAMAMSAALSFRTIFAMIPVIVLAVLALGSFSALEDHQEALHKFLDKAGVAQIAVTGTTESENMVDQPDGDSEPIVYNVADEIEKLVLKVQESFTFGKVGPVGMALLIWSALTLFTTLERSLNRIFGARRNRPLGKRIMLYWSVLTLVPIIMTAALYVCGRINADIVSDGFWARSVNFIGWIAPVIIGVFMTALVYRLMPNTKVSFRWSVFGAAIAVPLWMLGRRAFQIYVSEFVGKDHLYGTMALLPLFMLWLNLSWTIFLYGAVLSHTAANLSVMEGSELAARISLGPPEMLAAALAIAGPYCRGEGPINFSGVREKLNLPDESIQRLLDRLVIIGIICPVENDGGGGAYVPARPVETIGILEVLGFNNPSGKLPADVNDPILVRELTRISQETNKALGDVKLADIVLA